MSKYTESKDNVLRLSQENEELLSMMQARRLPTVNQLHAASYEGKFKHAGAETARP